MVQAAVLGALALGIPPATAQTPEEFFNDNVVHDIRLTINPSDWQRLRVNFLDDNYYPCDFQWRNISAQNIGIRSRGLGSRSGTKPGLRVDFDRFELTQTFLGLKSVVLRNNTQDASTMHERLSMLMFRRMGLPASREAHARLFINGQYFGLYTVVESVDKDFLQRNFSQNEGYLYEYRWVEPWKFEYRGSDPARYSPIPFKPETHERDPDPRPLEAWIRTLNQASDADFVRATGEYLDLRLFVTHLAVENFLAETDGIVGYAGTNNFYFYRFERRNLSQFIVWDKSETLADAGHQVTYNLNDSVLSRRALAVPELRRTYFQALVKAAVLAGARDGWLAQEVEREYNQIRQAAYEDPNKQCRGPDGAIRGCSNEEFENEITNIRFFARVRSDYVRSQAAENGFEPSAATINDGGAVNAASNAAGPIAPGSLVSLYGRGFGDATEVATSLPLPTALGGVSVIINGFPAPLLFVSPNQINLQIPWEIASGNTLITVLLNGVPGNTIDATVAPFSPGVFAVVHADGALVSPQRPAGAGDVLVVYANGLGPVTEQVTTGQAAPGSPLASTRETPEVTLGGVPADVLFSGLTPGFVGLYQINVRIGANVPAGAGTPLVVRAGGQASPPVTLATR